MPPPPPAQATPDPAAAPNAHGGAVALGPRAGGRAAGSENAPPAAVVAGTTGS